MPIDEREESSNDCREASVHSSWVMGLLAALMTAAGNGSK